MSTKGITIAAVVGILVIGGLSSYGQPSQSEVKGLNTVVTSVPTAVQEIVTPTPLPTNTPTPFPTATPTPKKIYVAPTSTPTPIPAATTQSGLSNDNYYTNSAGNEVHSPAYSNSVPAGATAICGDGTYSFSQSRRGTCSHHGGVSQWL
ncbi:MAG: DUF3761 domain-containing protein [Patescibacteria group bacterium]